MVSMSASNGKSNKDYECKEFSKFSIDTRLQGKSFSNLHLDEKRGFSESPKENNTFDVLFVQRNDKEKQCVGSIETTNLINRKDNDEFEFKTSLLFRSQTFLCLLQKN